MSPPPSPSSAPVPPSRGNNAEAPTAPGGPEIQTRELLAEFALAMDALIWNAWTKKLRPDSPVRREGQIRDGLLRALAGDPAALTRDLAALRRLTGALIAAVAQASERYAQLHVSRFGVESIEAAAQPRSMLESRPAACWRKYRELMGENDAGKARDLIESEILRCVAEFAETLAQGLQENESASTSEAADLLASRAASVQKDLEMPASLREVSAPPAGIANSELQPGRRPSGLSQPDRSPRTGDAP